MKTTVRYALYIIFLWIIVACESPTNAPATIMPSTLALAPTITLTPTATPTSTPVPTYTPTNTHTPEPTATTTPTPEPTDTPIPTPPPTDTPPPPPTATPTRRPTPTRKPDTPTPVPVVSSPSCQEVVSQHVRQLVWKRIGQLTPREQYFVQGTDEFAIIDNYYGGVSIASLNRLILELNTPYGKCVLNAGTIVWGRVQWSVSKNDIVSWVDKSDPSYLQSGLEARLYVARDGRPLGIMVWQVIP